MYWLLKLYSVYMAPGVGQGRKVGLKFFALYGFYCHEHLLSQALSYFVYKLILGVKFKYV